MHNPLIEPTQIHKHHKISLNFWYQRQPAPKNSGPASRKSSQDNKNNFLVDEAEGYECRPANCSTDK